MTFKAPARWIILYKLTHFGLKEKQSLLYFTAPSSPLWLEILACMAQRPTETKDFNSKNFPLQPFFLEHFVGQYIRDGLAEGWLINVFVGDTQINDHILRQKRRKILSFSLLLNKGRGNDAFWRQFRDKAPPFLLSTFLTTSRGTYACGQFIHASKSWLTILGNTFDDFYSSVKPPKHVKKFYLIG